MANHRQLFICIVALLACVTSLAQAQVVEDFESFPPGGRVSSVPAQGLAFENPLDVVRCGAGPEATPGSFCLGARSGNNVVRTVVNFEFTRKPFRINFAAAQESAEAYVRLDAPSARDGMSVRVSIGAVDENGDIFKSRAITFTHDYDDGIWHQLDITEDVAAPPFIEAQKIYGIVIWGQENDGSLPTPDEAANFLLIDDLGYNNIEAFPNDDLAPSITRFDLESPVSVSTAPVDIRVTERGPSPTARLDSVGVRVVHEGGTVVSDFDEAPLCGTGASVCPELEYRSPSLLGVGLQEGLPGEYTVTVRACDASGNCDQLSRSTVFEPPPPAPEVRSWKMEINQGLQTLSGLVEPIQSGIEAYPPAAGPFLPERNTLVRYYLTATDAPRSDYSTTMTLKVFKTDDSVTTYTLRPNTGPETVDVEVDPVLPADRTALAWSQRAELSKTLNFVIPRDLLQDATLFAVRLGQFGTSSDPVTGEMQVSLTEPNRFGILPIRLVSPLFTAPRAIDLAQQNKVLEAQFPISGELLYPNQTTGAWAPTTGESEPHIFRNVPYSGRAGDADCLRALRWVRRTFSGDEVTLSRSLANAPDRALITGIVGNGLDGCAGMAFRPGTASVNEVVFGVVMDHEMMHNFGSKHASNAHGEAGGGEFEPWPYPHGHMSPDGVSNMGVLMEQTDSSTSAGSWDVYLMDPCPVTPLDDLDQRLPNCQHTPEFDIIHDFMSYGANTPRTAGIPFGNMTFSWMSDITWDRAYQVFRDARRSLSTGTKADAKGNEDAIALIISGQINVDGSVEFDPLLRKSLPAGELSPAEGDHTLRVTDEAGAVLTEQVFSIGQYDDLSGDQIFFIVIQDQPDAASVELLGVDDASLAEFAASLNPPTVQLLSPNGGELIRDGEMEISWTGADPDGDELSYLVQISADDGETWMGITLTEPGDGSTFSLQTAGLIPSDASRVRVVASDGFNTATDDSDGTFELEIGPGYLFRNGFE